MNIFSTAAAATIVLYGTFEHGVWSPSHPDIYPSPITPSVVVPMQNLECEEWHPPLVYPEKCFEEIEN